MTWQDLSDDELHDRLMRRMAAAADERFPADWFRQKAAVLVVDRDEEWAQERISEWLS